MTGPAERKTRTRKPSKTAWTRKVEAQSLSTPHKLWIEAKENTKNAAKNPAFLVSLSQEIVLTRGPELTRTYRNLVWALSGFKRKGQGPRARTTGQVCVILVVRRKNLDLPEDHPQQLPRWLLTYAEWEGQRRPFAIPTDVQDADEYYAASAQANSGVWLRKQGYPAERGSFTCLARLRHDGGSHLCMLGAMHVFTPYPDGDSLQIESGLPILPLSKTGDSDTRPILAATLPWGGILRADERADRPSLDVQLAEVAPQGEAMLRLGVGLRRFNATKPWVESLEELLAFGTEFFLIPPDNHPHVKNRGAIRMHLGAISERLQPVSIPYAIAGNPASVTREVFHAELLRFKAKDDKKVPLGGDSGSPIVFRHDDQSMTLVGMHIAGDGKGASWAIPAWCCVNVSGWWAYPTGASLAPEDA